MVAFGFSLNNSFQKNFIGSVLLCYVSAVRLIKVEKHSLGLKNKIHFRKSPFTIGTVKCKDYDICIFGLLKIASSVTIIN